MKALYRFAQDKLPYLENLNLLGTERMMKCLDLMNKYVHRNDILLDIGSVNNLKAAGTQALARGGLCGICCWHCLRKLRSYIFAPACQR